MIDVYYKDGGTVRKILADNEHFNLRRLGKTDYRLERPDQAGTFYEPPVLPLNNVLGTFEGKQLYRTQAEATAA